ncbi:UvrD-helicase domain-containing protein [Legionella pneumophila serogroup 1]
MVKNRLSLEPEVNQILEQIYLGHNFLLSGGAGSGKTFSLVQLIRQLILDNPNVNIACITYTNAAVKEIEDRVHHKNLNVMTIHNFLWDNIKSYQKELRATLINLINDDNVNQIKSNDTKLPNFFFDDKRITYKEYTLLNEGIISHDELLILAQYMFKEYPKLCDILIDKFNYIFIDEYQDTNPLVINIFLEQLVRCKRKNIIGLFGDAMQSIYDDGVGNLNNYIKSGIVYEIKKEQNRRNPRLIYELANKLRTDNITQRFANDSNAPNMKDGTVKEGNIKFYYTDNEENLDKIKKLLDWDFTDSKKTKELNLTHNLIAPKAGFQKLMAVYDGDKILEYRNRIKKYIKDKAIQEDFSDLSFGQVIEKLLEGKATDSERKPILPTPAMTEFINKNPDLYERAKSIQFDIFKKIYVDKESLLDDKKEDIESDGKQTSKRDNLIKHLFKIQSNLNLYNNNKYNEFLRKIEFNIGSIADKKRLKETIFQLQNLTDSSIEEVIEFAHEKGICRKDDKLSEFIKSNQYIYDQVKVLNFKEFQNLFNYLEGYTPRVFI